MLQMNILNLPLLLAQTDPYPVPEFTDAEAAGLIGGLIAAVLAMAVPLLIVGAIYVVANWKIFEKAGQPGWAAIIPIYNIIVMLDVLPLSLS